MYINKKIIKQFSLKFFILVVGMLYLIGSVSFFFIQKKKAQLKLLQDVKLKIREASSLDIDIKQLNFLDIAHKKEIIKFIFTSILCEESLGFTTSILKKFSDLSTCVFVDLLEDTNLEKDKDVLDFLHRLRILKLMEGNAKNAIPFLIPLLNENLIRYSVLETIEKIRFYPKEIVFILENIIEKENNSEFKKKAIEIINTIKTNKS